MKRQALGWILFGSLWISGSLTAEPLSDLRTRLAALHSDEPMRIEVDIELKHRGSAPLHLNKTKRRGTAIVDYGPQGVRKIEQWWRGTGVRFSFWKKSKLENEASPLNDVQAEVLADPVEMMDFFVNGATLLSDESVTWEGQPARLLVIRPHPSASARNEAAPPPREDGGSSPFELEAKIWLNENGDPLAFERSAEFRLGGALKLMEQQTFTFQQVEGRLLVAEARETYRGSGLGVLHGRDDSKMTVTLVR